MINHVRTLLLNSLPALVGDQTIPGAEYVPPDYNVVTLPPDLQTVRQVLFGSAPDAYYLNCRAHQYLTMLHATELAEHVLALDPRVTYRPEVPDPALLRTAFMPVVNQYAGNPRTLSLGGVLTPDDARGRIRYVWSVGILGTSATVLQLQPDYSLVTSTPTSQSGATGPIALGNSGMYCYLAPGGNSNWTISITVRPGRTLGQVFDLVRPLLTEQRRASLFGPGVPPACVHLYDQHLSLPYRLGGVALALAYQTEVIRRGLN